MARPMLRKMPAWSPVAAVSVETGEAVLAMRMPEAFSFHVPDVKDADGKTLGHGGMVGGRAGDYVVLWGGEFCACSPLEVVPAAVIEERRARETEEKSAAEAARAAAVVSDGKGEDASAMALPRADEVPAETPAA